MPPRRLLRRLLAAAAALLALAYAGAIGYLILNERALIYQPAERHVAPPPARFALRERRVTYPSTDGVTLGDSTGTPDERGLYADADASYEYLTRTLLVPPERLVIFGHSLGSGVAIELASRVPAAGLIVEAAYTSIVGRAQELYPLFPVTVIASQRFPSLDRIPAIDMPKLFLHSPEDAVIPYAHGRRLFEVARAPKRFVDVNGGHDDAFRIDRDVFFGAIAQFLREITPESRRDASDRER